jgi:GNAT superfamily N-acetyltransferase
MDIRVIRARPEQAERLTQIAHAAKTYWGYPSQWIELWHNQLTITRQFILQNEVYAAVDDDEAILGFYALSGGGARMVLEHLWVQPRSLQGGVGRKLFAHAVALAAEQGAEQIEIEADPNAEGFYQKMGATTVGEVTYELEGLPRSLPLMVYPLRPGAPPFATEDPEP